MGTTTSTPTQQQLLAAIRSGNLTEVKEILEAGSPPTLEAIQAAGTNFEVLKLLVKYSNIDPAKLFKLLTTQETQGSHPLETEILTFVLNPDEPVFQRLLLATLFNQTPEVRTLIDEKEAEDNGVALVLASEMRYYGLVKYFLLRHISYPQQLLKQLYTKAVHNKDGALVDLVGPVLEHQSLLELLDTQEEVLVQTVLNTACFNGDVELVRYMVEQLRVPATVDALYHAIRANKIESASVLAHHASAETITAALDDSAEGDVWWYVSSFVRDNVPHAETVFTDWKKIPEVFHTYVGIIHAKQLKQRITSFLSHSAVDVSMQTYIREESRFVFMPPEEEQVVRTADIEYKGFDGPLHIQVLVNKELADVGTDDEQEQSEEEDSDDEVPDFLLIPVPDELPMVLNGFMYVTDLSFSEENPDWKIFESLVYILTMALSGLRLRDFTRVNLYYNHSEEEDTVILTINDAEKLPRLDIEDFPNGYKTWYPLYTLRMHIPSKFSRQVRAVLTRLQY